MKLKPDCVRDVLLSIEKLQIIEPNADGTVRDKGVNYVQICKDLPKQSKEDIFYTLKILRDGGMVDMRVQYANNGTVYHCVVDGLTFRGHEFMQNLKDDKKWGLVKKGLDAIRTYSLDAMSSVAEGITTAAIQAYIQQGMQG